MVPSELKQLPQWIVWRLEDRQGKPTKVPYRPDGKGMAVVDSPLTWSTARAAYDRWQMGNGHPFNGLGFVVTAEDPYCGIDLDHCFDKSKGEIAPWAQKIVDRFNSYTEVTPSEAGLRIWIKGKLPGTRNRTGDIELYDHDRYFTTTGWRLDSAPQEIQERQAELDAFYQELFPPQEPRVRALGSASLDAYSIMEKARSAVNAVKFERLMHGDIGGYSSASEADLALASLVAFYSEDAGMVEQVIRLSGLWDEKWERPDYRERTIRKAIEERDDRYSGSLSVLPQPVSENGAAPAQTVSEEPESSWTPVNLADVLNSDLSPLEPVILPRTDGIRLLYPGRVHMFLGEPESCKSWAAQVAVAEVLQSGKSAVYIDFEAEAREVVTHLLALGVSQEAILQGLSYLRPEEPLTPSIKVTLMAHLEAISSEMTVVDGVNSALVADDKEPNSNKDFGKWWRELVRALQLRTHGPVVIIDHVGKDKERRGDWSVGAGQKKALIDGAMLAFEVIHAFGRGRTGMMKLLLFKDRPGYLRGQQGKGKEIARLRLISDSESGQVTAELAPPAGAGEGEEGGDEQAPWRPTGYMERISRVLELEPEPLSKTQLVVRVQGKAKYVRDALSVLVAEGFVEAVSGSRSSLLHRSLKAFREESETTPSRPRPDPVPSAGGLGKDDPVPNTSGDPLTGSPGGGTGSSTLPWTTPDTPSPSPTGRGEEDKKPVRPRCPSCGGLPYSPGPAGLPQRRCHGCGQQWTPGEGSG